jgi:hypothetical protein
MAGTVKLCVPELPDVAGLVGRADFVAATEGLALAVRTGVTEIVGVADAAGFLDFGDEVGADVGDDGATAAEALEAGADAAAEELDPVPAHAVRPATPATATSTAAGTRDILITFTFR